MLIQLAVMGLLAAMLPLALVWVSGDPNKYRKLAWVTVFLTFDLIMFGAFTRLTDSGLGCPDWPGCYGQANPFLAHAEIHAAQTLIPGGPVSVMKAWIEMIHRYLAMGVGVLIIALLASAWRNWRKTGLRHFNPWLPTVLLIMVCVQGAFGAWTVSMKLQPMIVTTHLLLGLSLLALLTWLAARQSEHAPIPSQAATLRTPAALALILLFVQIALGGWVSTNYAALACVDFPLCHAALLPQMDFAHGFTLWRHLGKTADGEFLPFPALTAIHWVHRSFALLVIACIVWVARRGLTTDGVRNTAGWLLMVVGLQFVSGVSTIFLKWPLAIAVLHNGGAALLVLLLVMLNYKIRITSQLASSITHTRSSSI